MIMVRKAVAQWVGELVCGWVGVVQGAEMGTRGEGFGLWLGKLVLGCDGGTGTAAGFENRSPLPRPYTD